MFKLFTNARKNNESNPKSKSGGKREKHCFAKTGLLFKVDFRNAEDGAVSGDKRQKNSERRMKRRQKTFHCNIDKLDERGNDQNKGKSMDVIKIIRLQKPMINTPRNGRGDRHNKDDRPRHAKSSFRFFGNAKKRTASKKAAENEVVNKNRPDKNYNISTHNLYYSKLL